MEKEQRTKLQKATQEARRLLEDEFSRQLLETYDINVDKGRWSEEPGAHLQAEQRLLREKLLAWIKHKKDQIKKDDSKAEEIKATNEALLLTQREMAFTALNRFVALKLMEARELVRPCVSGGLESEGFQEFTAVAQGLVVDQESSYRLYLETIFEDVSRELRALFDPRDPASLLWPKRTALLELMDILNRPELAELWREDETLGWVYQYFNGDAERKKMREESDAPRNSRELAVRNQFFTPRYVVEFLTDNTLGRIWYEMRQGDTGLKERCRYLVRRPNEIWLQPGEEAPAEVVADKALSQEELLRQPVHIPYRPLKDPREIRMLDPACGSMHFGLYAFDLYLAIYEEAWEIAQGSDEQAKQGEAFAAFVTYAADFASKAAFMREVPRLILLHNIHGVDIDPRATQIARLTLWLRSQRAWQEQQLEVAARPAITRSNVVCAEPMPGERELLADFVDQQFPEAERGLVQQLLETIFDKMQLAGEAGSLLKIEEEIRDAIEQARREWQKLAIQQRDLFSAAEMAELGGVGSALNTDLQNLTKDFWVDIEQRIYDALRDYANQAESGGGFQRRLFAEDAAQGFAFIDVCRKSYDVALMNPPFGERTKHLAIGGAAIAPYASLDLYAAFICRAIKLSLQDGLIGALTPRAGFFLSRFAEWRNNLFANSNRQLIFADLGYGVLDEAMIETAAYCFSNRESLGNNSQCVKRETDWSGLQPDASLSLNGNHSIFYRLLSSTDKSNDLAWRENVAGLSDRRIFTASIQSFASIPGSPFVYWAPKSIYSLFKESGNEVKYESRAGMQTCDDFRFIRLAFEVPHQERALGRWRPLSKGGKIKPFYSDLHLLVSWGSAQRELEAYGEIKGNEARSRQSSEYYFKAGITWPRRPHLRGHFSMLPPGSIFTDTGPAIFSLNIDKWALCAILNSTLHTSLLHLLMPRGTEESGQTLKYEMGYLEATPIKPPSKEQELLLASTSAQIWRILRCCDEWNETSHQFKIPRLLLHPSEDLNKSVEMWHANAAILAQEAHDLYQRVEVIASDMYGLSVDDMTAISGTIEPVDFFKIVFGEGAISGTDADQPPEVKGYLMYANSCASELLSWLFGLLIGRFHAPGSLFCDGSGITEQDDLLPSLPVKPAAIKNNGDSCSAPEELIDALSSLGQESGERFAQLYFPCFQGILVADSSFASCWDKAFEALIESMQIGDSSRLLDGIKSSLALSSIFEWFNDPSKYFSMHLKYYTKSRRQAPVYWQISAGNGDFSFWLYYQYLTSDTLYRLLRDFVEPGIKRAELEQFELESYNDPSRNVSKRLLQAQSLLQDLRLLKSELDLVAPLWNPNLNDGVIINHAILWRITPYTPWQKKCKECWDKLVGEEYEWAHLAFHLWPERVIRKCLTDRSLAIAHGLEERLWQETNKGNWLQRQVSEVELQALIAEHSKPAVQNALERFLAAPPPVAAARIRAPRAAKSSSTGTTRRPRGSAAVVDAEASRQTLLVLTDAPAEGLGRNAIAELLDVEAASLTAVIKQLKESGQLEQLGAARGAKYRLSEQGRASLEPEQDA